MTENKIRPHLILCMVVFSFFCVQILHSQQNIAVKGIVVDESEEPIKGGELNYSRKKENRQWNDKMYLFPIPQSELVKNKNLTQNPGW